MFFESYEIFEIIDIIRLKRKNIELNTNNKEFCCISCRLQGESLFFYNKSELCAKKGDILYIPKDCSYSQKTTGEEIVCFHLTAYRGIKQILTILTGEHSDEVCRLFDEAEKIWKQKKNNYYYECLSILYKILSLSGFNFSYKFNSDEESVIETEKIKKAVEYLSKNLYNSQLSVNEVYKITHMGRTNFNELFKTLYGCTPRKYIYKERINKAKMLLNTGSYTNEEIAQLCGFTDVKYFYVVFKKVTGMSTKEYKKRDYPEFFM